MERRDALVLRVPVVARVLEAEGVKETKTSPILPCFK